MTRICLWLYYELVIAKTYIIGVPNLVYINTFCKQETVSCQPFCCNLLQFNEHLYIRSIEVGSGVGVSRTTFLSNAVQNQPLDRF